MNKNLRGRVLIICGVLLAAVYFAFPLDQRINLGLDLKGGMHLVLRVKSDNLSPDARTDAVLRAIEIIRSRIDGMGVGETVIQRQGDDQILVQLPGVTDREAAYNMIGKVALLEFRLVNSNPTLLEQALQGKIPDGHILAYSKEDSQQLLLSDNVSVKGEAIKDARVDFDQFNQPTISFTLKSDGAKDFAKLTRENVNESLAIVVDGEVLSAPNIREPILTGSGEINGQFTFEEASMLALQLRSGALPAPMEIEEERTVGPLLGKDSIEAGITATVAGATLVFIFMFIYYLKAGFISDLALAVNIFLIVGIMGFLKVMLPESQITLTLPGIAGIILTLGMAVDANVLINERIREEIDAGRPINSAINNGFNKAFKAIFDSNTTTLIAAFMLFQFGSGPIKGFAVTLSIGLLATLFTALFVTRTLLNLFYNFNLLKTLPMLAFFKNTNINFIAPRFLCFILSAALGIASIYMFISKGETAYGIDFAGGQIQEYRFDRPVPTEEVRAVLKEVGLEDVVIQRFENFPNNLMIRSSEDTYDEVSKVLAEKMSDNHYEVLRIEKVGPVVGAALRQRALLAIVFALGGILIYVGFRFSHFDFATAGVIALLHDVLITAGILLMIGRQIDLLVVTALLTIAGYSINDTIIIYDRVRENTIRSPKAKLADNINLSVNQTLGRTILTTLTTMLVVVSLYLKGGEVLNTFALTLLIGFVLGTYSTIFIASPLVLAWQKK